MGRRATMGWMWVHRWSSLACTAFLLMLCVTGLPLIFHQEIDGWLSPPPPLAVLPPAAPRLPLDALRARGEAAHPGEGALYLSFDDERPVAGVTTAPRPDAPGALMHYDALDARTGALLPPARTGLMATILALHVDLMLGYPAELMLGGMGVLFVVAIVSGVVVYLPFGARTPFGAVRTERTARVRRLDRHNLVGLVTLAWALVVGATGVVNTLALPITQHWKADQLAQLGSGPAVRRATVSLDAAYAGAQAAAPGLRLQFVAFPGAAYSSERHLAFFFQGTTPLTRRLLTPVFADAATGRVVLVGRAPWYMTLLLLAEPLHFGDYGGLPLKLAWALLDLLTIAVLWTGLRLWDPRRAGRPRATRHQPRPLFAELPR